MLLVVSQSDIHTDFDFARFFFFACPIETRRSKFFQACIMEKEMKLFFLSDILFFWANVSFYILMISRAFTIHRTEGEWGSYLVNSFLPPPPVLQTLRISWLVTLEISSLHITSSRTRTRNVLVCECKSLTTTLHALKCASVFNFDYIYLLSHIVL